MAKCRQFYLRRDQGVMDDAKKRQVYCKTCNVRTEAKVVATHVKSQLADPRGDPVDSPYYVTVYEFAVCSGCEEPFLFEHDYIEVPGEFLVSQGERMLYPDHDVFPGKGVPETVRHAHQDAVRSYAAGLYGPCVLMCRKCIEAMCYELGETKGNLRNRLLALSDQQKIDSKLIMWLDGLRVIGNDAAHDLYAQIDKSDAFDSLHFVEAVLMYVFSLNTRYDEFRSRRARPSK